MLSLPLLGTSALCRAQHSERAKVAPPLAVEHVDVDAADNVAARSLDRHHEAPVLGVACNVALGLLHRVAAIRGVSSRTTLLSLANALSIGILERQPRISELDAVRIADDLEDTRRLVETCRTQLKVA